MELGLKDKVAIVPASSKGLGRAVAMGLAAEGAKLTICSRNEDDINKTAKEIIDTTGSQVLALNADVSDQKELEYIVNKTTDTFGTIHILINNAGGPPFGYFDQFDMEQWQKAIELNLFSTIRLTQLVTPYMIDNMWGRIINITSIAVKQPLDGLILSNTSRAGVTGFAKTISNELAKHNILVNNVCPGRIFTDRIKSLADSRAKQEGKSFEQIIEAMQSDIPVGKIGTPEEFANMVVFLASEKASYITGNTIQIDGGLLKGIF
ncbi:MAG TPA: SDR family oxidoreductase [Thermodesulfobacteriota bacterium]|nr:SDR family oxidoreductase [Thermodesulfobacteriota bacterium]